jgi:hypothetical protein
MGEARKYHVEYNGQYLIFTSELDFERAKSLLKKGAQFMVELVQPRNAKQHRLLCALIDIVQKNSPQTLTFENVLDELKMNCGMTKLIKYRGLMLIVPDSISFAQCSQEKFQEFFVLALDYIVREFIPRLNKRVLIEQLVSITGQDLNLYKEEMRIAA